MEVFQNREHDVVLGNGPVAVGNRKKIVEPGGLAGWVLGMIRGRGAKAAGRHLQVVETLALGGRRQLVLVTCDGERFLVGSGADSVQTIVPVHGSATKTVTKTATKAAEETWV